MNIVSRGYGEYQGSGDKELDAFVFCRIGSLGICVPGPGEPEGGIQE